jgi:hypothetical protein
MSTYKILSGIVSRRCGYTWNVEIVAREENAKRNPNSNTKKSPIQRFGAKESLDVRFELTALRSS